jgi:hypothetical protein
VNSSALSIGDNVQLIGFNSYVPSTDYHIYFCNNSYDNELELAFFSNGNIRIYLPDRSPSFYIRSSEGYNESVEVNDCFAYNSGRLTLSYDFTKFSNFGGTLPSDNIFYIFNGWGE